MKKPRVVGGVEMVPWIKAIPESPSHGSGTLQKRLWRLVSDYVRIRDWYLYRGKCIATGRFIPHWSQGNAGHFKPYSKCNGLFKFDTNNVHLQYSQSNIMGSYEDWIAFEEEMIKRTGLSRHDIDRLNSQSSLKFTNQDLVLKMEGILAAMRLLPEQPAYYNRVAELRAK